MLFVNDSKATNADAAGKALASFSDIYWIIGGRPKEGGIGGLGAFLRQDRARLPDRRGGRRLRRASSAAPSSTCNAARSTRAVEAAAADAGRSPRQEPVVLLSPACASYDQFANFEKRGEAFRRIVMALDGAESVTPEQGKAA